jgi:hypothetical protein
MDKAACLPTRYARQKLLDAQYDNLGVDLKATIRGNLGKWLEVDDMRIFQIRIPYHCQISQRRIIRHSPR